MLPVGKEKGHILLRNQFLCDVDYDIGEPLSFESGLQVQRIALTVSEEHCAALLNAYDLVLVLADGQRCPIPRPIQHLGLNNLECYVESLE
jgi:hypothetical protein